jgi:hypothetical protein
LFLVGLAVAGLLGFFAYRSGQVRGRTARVVRCRVAEMRDGVCKVKGRLAARGEFLTSPLTRKKCLYYHFVAQQAYLVRTWTAGSSLLGEGDTTMNDRESYRPLVEDEQRVAVALEDETGVAYLDLRDVEGQSLVKRVITEIDTSLDKNVWFDLMLQKRYSCSTLVGRRKKGLTVSPDMDALDGPDLSLEMQISVGEGRELPKARVREEIIEEGDEVIVVGEVETRDGRPPCFRPVDYPLIVATHPRDARLPPPVNTSRALWVAASIVLALTMLGTVVGVLIVAASLISGRRR